MKEYIEIINKTTPTAWKQAVDFRKNKGKQLPNWASFCYLPFAGWLAISTQGEDLDFSTVLEAQKLAAIGTWRITKGIFSFNKYLVSELTKTNFTGRMPSDIFKRLPHWCCYINYKFNFLGKEACGFYIYLDDDMNSNRVELRFLIDYGVFESLISVPLHIGDWTVTEAVDRYLLEASKQAKIVNNPILTENISADINSLINIVLYLCSDEPEYFGKVPTRPQVKKTKKGRKLFAATDVTIFKIGEKTGAKIKKYSEYCTNPKNTKNKKPHIRKAHWHGYWTGSKTEIKNPQKFIHKWIPPVFVGFNDDESKND